MADINVYVPLPVIVSGQYFRIRYRKLGDVPWTNFANQDNDPFVITGLDDNTTYEVEITLYNGTQLCTPVIYTKRTTEEEFECPEFEAEIQEDNGLYYVHIIFPTPADEPACGWRVTITGSNGIGITYNYTSSPIDEQLTISIAQNETTNVKIEANFCNGAFKECYNEDVPPFTFVCTPMVLTATTVEKQFPSGKYQILISGNNSSPITNPIVLNFKQKGTITAGSADQGTRSINFPTAPGGPFGFNQEVHPNAAVSPTLVWYEGNIVDLCGNTHYFITNQIDF